MKISTTRVILVSLENILSLVECSQPCTVPSHGQCACLLDSVQQRIPMPVSNIYSHRDKLAFQLLSICLLSMAMTLITHERQVSLANVALPSLHWSTWKSYSLGYHLTK